MSDVAVQKITKMLSSKENASDLRDPSGNIKLKTHKLQCSSAGEI